MEINYFLGEAGLPPGLQPLVGLPIIEAYLLSEEKTVVLIFEPPAPSPRQLLMAEAMSVHGSAAVKIEVGDLKEGDKISNMLKELALPSLVGRVFTGLDGDILTFGSVGAQFKPGKRIQFMRDASVSQDA